MQFCDFLQQYSTLGKAQILRFLLLSKKLNGATPSLGFHKVTKESKVKHNVIENISDPIIFFGKSRKKYISDAGREIQTTIIPASATRKCLTTRLKKH